MSVRIPSCICRYTRLNMNTDRHIVVIRVWNNSDRISISKTCAFNGFSINRFEIRICKIIINFKIRNFKTGYRFCKCNRHLKWTIGNIRYRFSKLFLHIIERDTYTRSVYIHGNCNSLSCCKLSIACCHCNCRVPCSH